MTSSPPPILRICYRQESSELGGALGGGGEDQPRTYFCFSDERCCKEGCCTGYNFKLLQSWYFWLAILVAFLLYRYACYKCARVEQERIRHQRHLHTHRDDVEVCNANCVTPPPFINHLIVSYTNLESNVAAQSMPFYCKPEDGACIEPPPGYSDAIHFPKPCQPDDENVPTYEEAVRNPPNA